MSETIERMTPAEAGCWVPGLVGRYGSQEVISIAVNCGWDDEDAQRILDSDDNEAIWDAVIDVADDAEIWLNEHVAPEGYYFGWYDGEFWLWSEGDWQEAVL